MTAVAEGAAIAAGILRGTIDDLDFHVGAEHALGTVARDDATGESRFSVLIGRNTKYPARTTAGRTRRSRTSRSRWRSWSWRATRTSRWTHEDNVVLTDWVIPLPEPRPMAEARLDITYEYDVDGILHVKVLDHRTESVLMDGRLEYGSAP